MSSTYSWAIQKSRISRRFTTLEGWHELGNGVYTTGTSLRAIAVENQFDPSAYNDDRTSWTRPRRSEHGSLGASSRDFEQEWAASPISDKRGTIVGGGVVEEEVYHVFERREKWSVVAMIGVAGLFSGLSSNIFFPSLDAISKVRSNTPTCRLRRQHQRFFAKVLSGKTVGLSELFCPLLRSAFLSCEISLSVVTKKTFLTKTRT